MQKNVILILLFSILVAVFSIQNAHSVSVSFFTLSFEVSLIVVILGAIAFGSIIMGLFGSIKQLRLKREIRAMRRERDELLENNKQLVEKLDYLQKQLDEGKKIVEEDSIKEENVEDNKDNA